MKKERIVELIILFFISLVLIAGMLVFRHYKYEKPNTYNIVFKDIDSIVKGSPVRFMGINVGHVMKLKRKDKFIICKIRITKKGVKIPDGTRATVAFNGLGGSKSIELFPPLTNEEETRGIVASDSLRISEIVRVVEDLKDVCEIIDAFVKEIDTDAMMDELKEITNPEIIERIDSDLEKIIKEQNKSKNKPKSNFFNDAQKAIDKLLKK